MAEGPRDVNMAAPLGEASPPESSDSEGEGANGLAMLHVQGTCQSRSVHHRTPQLGPPQAL